MVVDFQGLLLGGINSLTPGWQYYFLGFWGLGNFRFTGFAFFNVPFFSDFVLNIKHHHKRGLNMMIGSTCF